MWQTLPPRSKPPAVESTDHVVRDLFIMKGHGMFFFFFPQAGSVLPCVSSTAKYQFLLRIFIYYFVCNLCK